MIQYRRHATEFFNIWQGGLVLYGSAIGGGTSIPKGSLLKNIPVKDGNTVPNGQQANGWKGQASGNSGSGSGNVTVSVICAP